MPKNPTNKEECLCGGKEMFDNHSKNHCYTDHQQVCSDDKVISFISDLLDNKRGKFKDVPPMSVSEWKKWGLMRGYWNYFETEIRKDWEDEKRIAIESYKQELVEKASELRKNEDKYCECNNVKCVFNHVIQDFIDIIKKS